MKFSVKLAHKTVRNLILLVLALSTFFGSVVLNPKVATQFVLNQPIQVVESASALTGDKLPYDPGVSLSVSRGVSSSHAGYDFAPPNGNPNNVQARAFRNGVLESITYGEGSGGYCTTNGQISGPLFVNYLNQNVPANSGFGNVVRIKHVVNGVAYYSKYAHLDSISSTIANLSKGSQIPQGTELGKIGTTGCSTATHLHFEYGQSISGGVGTGESISFDEGVNGPSQNSGQVTPPATQLLKIRADFNGDGKTDILRQEKVGDNELAISIMYSDGNSFQGGLTPIRDWPLMGQNVGTNAVKLFAGDFNGDGKTDLLRQERDADGSRDVEIYYSNGNGFNIPVTIRWQIESAGGFKGGTNLILN